MLHIHKLYGVCYFWEILHHFPTWWIWLFSIVLEVAMYEWKRWLGKSIYATLFQRTNWLMILVQFRLTSKMIYSSWDIGWKLGYLLILSIFHIHPSCLSLKLLILCRFSLFFLNLRFLKKSLSWSEFNAGYITVAVLYRFCTLNVCIDTNEFKTSGVVNKVPCVCLKHFLFLLIKTS